MGPGLSCKNNQNDSFDFDLFVIGGGSGGISVAREAGRLGAKVGLCNFVTPSGKGNTWGLGGTCVNVGCVPKKLFHIAAEYGPNIADSAVFGWDTPAKGQEVNWKQLTAIVQGHIKTLNWGFKVVLHNSGVKFYNCYGKLTDEHTVELKDKDGKLTSVSANYIVIATGGRPKYLSVPGGGRKGFVVTSDDLFSLPYPPGKTLCIGGSYVALECASFLNGLKYATDVMVRDQLLRNYDTQIASILKDCMEERGVKFHMGFRPTEIRQISSGEPPQLEVVASDGTSQLLLRYNTVLLAIGRHVTTETLGLDKAGVRVNPENGKIITNKYEGTSVGHIFAIGDVADNRPELTPPAIKAGIFLARRLFGGSKELMDYKLIPSTIFSSPEYSFVGLSEDEALRTYGVKNVEVYHAYFTPMEEMVTCRWRNECYLKIICLKHKREKIAGWHYVGPNAGEVCVGYALAMRLGTRKSDLDHMCGIHPTNSELFTTLTKTKSSGETATHTAC